MHSLSSSFVEVCSSITTPAAKQEARLGQHNGEVIVYFIVGKGGMLTKREAEKFSFYLQPEKS